MTKYESVDLPLVMTIRRSWVLKKTLVGSKYRLTERGYMGFT